MKVIDVHCHVVPSDFPAAPCTCAAHWPQMNHRPDRQAMVMMGSEEFRLVDERCWDVSRRTADMDAQGVDIQVLSPMPELLAYWIDAKDALELARHVNGRIAEMVAAAPTRFAGLGMVPLQDPELAARELERVKSDHRLQGIEIGSNINGRSPGDPHFDGFYREAERLGLAIFVHALHPAATERIVGNKRLNALISFPTDVGLAAASFITGGVMEKFPALRVGFSHGGGTLCAFLPRLQSGWGKLSFLKTSFASPTEAARRFYFDNIVFDPRLLEYLMGVVGATQVFVGSDYPFVGGQEKSAQMFETLGVTDDQLRLLRHENARRFLALPEVAETIVS